MPNKYLFILSPPYSGSTVLWRLLQTSEKVSGLPDEGQKLPELRDMMRSAPWDPHTVFDWGRIKTAWHAHWDLSKPVLLEKSPPHLCRAAVLQEHFHPSHFILLLRDPLAISEALHRRNGLSWEAAIVRWLDWLELHLQCRRNLADTHILYYEDLVTRPVDEFRGLATWLPELADVNPLAEVRSHAIDGVQNRSLTDLNPQKARNTSAEGRAIVSRALNTDRARDLLRETSYAEAYLT